MNLQQKYHVHIEAAHIINDINIEHIAFPLSIQGRRDMWEFFRAGITNLRNYMEEIECKLNPYPALGKGKKHPDAETFSEMYKLFDAMADKLADFVDALDNAVVANDNAQRFFDAWAVGLEPFTFEAFRHSQGLLQVLPSWVAPFKRQKEISVDDTLDACSAFLLDWAQNRKKDDCGFWVYTPIYDRKAG
ncbi:MAG: hypothetical protein II964_00750 [Synergistaceae bacterium]|nr:hypothetical protein [Synergistaceae bacterium]